MNIKQVTKENIKTYTLFVVLLLSFLSFTACPNVVLPVPKQMATDSEGETLTTSNYWGAPQNLVASQGLQKRIVLSWQPVLSATYYYIYEADAPSKDFEYCGQVSANSANGNEFSVTCAAGCDKWFIVRAKNADGKMSSPSIKVRGTSLAEPLITSIKEGEISSSQATVEWWMNNLNDGETYQKNVQYTVYCTDKDGNEKSSITYRGIDENGNALPLEVTFKNLEATTDYYYQVFAYNINYQNETENSDRINAQTAHKQTPNKVEDLVATQGDDKEKITLTFTLPSKVDIAEGSMGMYTPYPLYFKIYRKLESSDKDFELIEDELKFPFGLNNSDFENSEYEAGKKITWEDKDTIPASRDNLPLRGKKYIYKVQSYAEYPKRIISSNESCAEVTGWMVGNANFALGAIQNKIASSENQTQNEELDANNKKQKYVNTTVGFNVDFETYGKDDLYKYFISEKRFKLDLDNNDTKDETGEIKSIKEYETLDDIKSFVYSMPYGTWSGDVYTETETTKATRGYYNYVLYVMPKNFTLDAGDFSAQIASLTNSCYSAARVLADVLVTDDTAKPEIKDFAAKGGYKDKIVLTWTYDPTITYSVYYATSDNDEKIQLDQALVDAAIQNVTGGIVTVEHKVDNGFKAKYTIKGYRGVWTEKESGDDYTYTLGTPQPKFDTESLDYKSITLKWQEVAEANKYQIIYAYTDDSTKGETLTELAVSDLQDKLDENGNYTYTFATKDDFCNDPAVSGKNITVTLKAISDVDNTSNDVTAYTEGPANTGVRTSRNTKQIAVYWNVIPGAKGYVIKRERYDYDTQKKDWSSFADEICYYVDDSGASPTISLHNDSSKINDFVKITKSSTTFTLQDTAREKKDTDNGKWCVEQDMLFWGVPYKYTVIPVKSEDDFDATNEGIVLAESVTYAEAKLNDLFKSEKNGNVNYANLNSTVGFGRNVTATKSEYNDRIKITWDKPFFAGDNAPQIYRRKVGGTSYEYLVTLDSGAQKYEDKSIKGKNRIEPYEYTVVYANGLAPTASYIKSLQETKSSSENSEPINKGYEFALGLDAGIIGGMDNEANKNNASYYGEALYPTAWDYEKRAVGPASNATYYIQINNRNNTTSENDEWVTVATFTQKNGTLTFTAASDVANKITVTTLASGVQIKPTFAGGDNIDYGLLQVLRDYRHYARIYVQNENGDLDALTCHSKTEDDSLPFAYRNITENELCRCVSLIIADALYQTGIPGNPGSGKSISATNAQYAESGYLKINAFYSDSKVSWGFDNTNYIHKFMAGTSMYNTKAFVSDFILTSSISNEERGAWDNMIYHLPTLTVTANNKNGLPSYNGTFSYTIGGTPGIHWLTHNINSYTYDLTITNSAGTEFAKVNSDRNKMIKYFPYNLGDENKEGKTVITKNSITSYRQGLPPYIGMWWR